jgi:hypothetical protein
MEMWSFSSFITDLGTHTSGHIHDPDALTSVKLPPVDNG